MSGDPVEAARRLMAHLQSMSASDSPYCVEMPDGDVDTDPEQQLKDIRCVCRALLPQDGDTHPITPDLLGSLGFVRPMQSADTDLRTLEVNGNAVGYHGRSHKVKSVRWSVNGELIPEIVAPRCMADVLDLIERLKGGAA